MVSEQLSLPPTSTCRKLAENSTSFAAWVAFPVLWGVPTLHYLALLFEVQGTARLPRVGAHSAELRRQRISACDSFKKYLYYVSGTVPKGTRVTVSGTKSCVTFRKTRN